MCAVSVSLSVCHEAQLGFTVRGSFGAAFAKSFWPLVRFLVWLRFVNLILTLKND